MKIESKSFDHLYQVIVAHFSSLSYVNSIKVLGKSQIWLRIEKVSSYESNEGAQMKTCDTFVWWFRIFVYYCGHVEHMFDHPSGTNSFYIDELEGERHWEEYNKHSKNKFHQTKQNGWRKFENVKNKKKAHRITKNQSEEYLSIFLFQNISLKHTKWIFNFFSFSWEVHEEHLKSYSHSSHLPHFPAKAFKNFIKKLCP